MLEDKMNSELTPEQLAFSYIYSALDACARIDDYKKEYYEKLFINNKSPSKKEIETIVPKFTQRLKALAEKDNIQDYWSLDNVKKYWREEHNRIINAGEDGYENSTPEQKNICKTHFIIIGEIFDNSFLGVLKNNKKRKFCNPGKKLKQGNYATVHNGFIAEPNIPEKVYKRYTDKNPALY